LKGAIKLQFKLPNKKGKITPKIIFFGCLPIAIFSVLFSGILCQLLQNGRGPFKPIVFNLVVLLKIGALTAEGMKFTALSILVIVGGIAYMKFKGKILKEDGEMDERGFKISSDGTYGTAKFQDLKAPEAQKLLEVLPISKCTGIILGQVTEDASQVIAISTKGYGINNHVALFGSSGTGKSRGFIRANILQAIRREESIVVTDPKGELTADMYKVLESNGYTVKVLNLIDFEHSDVWNCLAETIDPKTGDMSDTNVMSFAEILIKNTSEKGKGGDQFWGLNEKNLLKAMIMLVGIQHKSAVFNEISQIYLKASDRVRSGYKETFNPIDVSNIWKTQEFKFSYTTNDCITAVKNFLDACTDCSPIEQEEYIAKALEKANKIAPLNLGTVYSYFTTKDVVSINNLFKSIPETSPAKMAWNIFCKGNENVIGNIIQGAAIQLQLLQNADLQRVINNNDISLYKPGKEKCAYFCIISDRDTTFKAISSLFFTFLFKDLSDSADAAGIDKSKVKPVNFILDEFANIGEIPEFDKIISLARSRKINITFALQSIGQLYSIYTKDLAGAILSNCDTQILLGCNDDDTAKMFSARSGEATIYTESIKNDKMLGHIDPMFKQYSTSTGSGKRMMLTTHEIRTLSFSGLVITVRSLNIIKANKVDYTLHPLSNKGKLEQTDLATMPSTRERFPEIGSNIGATPKLDNSNYSSNAIAFVHNSLSQNGFVPKPSKSENVAPVVEVNTTVFSNAGDSACKPKVVVKISLDSLKGQPLEQSQPVPPQEQQEVLSFEETLTPPPIQENVSADISADSPQNDASDKKTKKRNPNGTFTKKDESQQNKSKYSAAESGQLMF